MVPFFKQHTLCIFNLGKCNISIMFVNFCVQDAISASSTVPSLDSRIAPSPQYAVAASSGLVPQPPVQGSMMPFSNKQFPQSASIIKPLAPEPTMQSSPAREEGEVPESELDPDTRRRLLILQHGQDTRDHTSNDPPFPVRPPAQVSVPRVQARGSWFPVDEELSPRQLNRAVPKEFPLDSDTMHIEKHRPHHPPFFNKVESSVSSDRIPHENQRLSREVICMWFWLYAESWVFMLKANLLLAY